MDIEQTDTSDPNAAVLLNEDGLCAYGKLPPGAIGEITQEEISEVNSHLAGAGGSMDDLREAASGKLQELGYGPIQWPLPDEDMNEIRDGKTPEGLFLTHLTYSAESTGIQNGTTDEK
jgi:hypothetical protein